MISGAGHKWQAFQVASCGTILTADEATIGRSSKTRVNILGHELVRWAKPDRWEKSRSRT